MTSARSNVSAVVVRDRLYAVGGFSGKTFLNTIEYLDPETNEWTTFVPQQEIDLNNIAESLKEVVENGRNGKSASPIPPAVVEALQNGANTLSNGNGHPPSSNGVAEDATKEERTTKPKKTTTTNGGSCNGKLGQDSLENGHPRVADECEVNGSS